MSSMSFGQRIREQRQGQNVSLRKFAERIGISPAFLVDIEKDRRKPSPSLLQRIADELDVPLSAFDEFSPDLPKPVSDWAQANPVLGRALQLIKKFREPRDALALLERGAAPSVPRRFAMAIYESELQAIGHESSSWESETGGDLFGIWGDIPIVYLATKSGPNSVRDHAHFRLDVDYLIKLSVQLQQDWGLRYFGDWHSHHRLRLQAPSGGDRARIQRLASKNAFHEMAEFIVTFASSYDEDRAIQIHPYAYLQLPSGETTDVVLIVLEGTSPVRDTLATTGALPHQDLMSSLSFPMERVTIPREPLPRVSGNGRAATQPISDRVLRRAVAEMEALTPGKVELHDTRFGYVLVVPVNEIEHVAFAIEESWPHKVLQVDWMNREEGTTKELPISSGGASLANLSNLVSLFRSAISQKGDRPP